jgi:alkylglycerol monooxygenase
MGIIQASIPLFFLLIGIELLVARRRGLRIARVNDSISDLSLGTLSQIAGIGLKLVTIGIYIVVVEHLSVQRFIPVPEWSAAAPLTSREGWPWIAVHAVPLASWVTVFLLVDLAYYWMHRCSHVVHLLWAGHVVHHSSEEYNLPVALRQSALHGLTSWVFYIPLALVGIPAVMFVVAYGLNLVYQFWIHTRVIGRLGPLEWVLNTPSHHRVHHGINPEYLDRNYGGVFIIWDRLFGTFEPERAEPVYGLTSPLASWNPLWANVHVYVQIARSVARVSSWRDRLRVVFGHPAWRPAELGGAVAPRPVEAHSYEKFDPPLPQRLLWYALAQFAVVLAASVALLGAAPDLPGHQVLAAGFYIAVALAGVGGALERQGWTLLLEQSRLFTLSAVAAVLVWFGMIPLPAGAVIILAGMGSAIWLWRIREDLDAPAAVTGMLAA